MDYTVINSVPSQKKKSVHARDPERLTRHEIWLRVIISLVIDHRPGHRLTTRHELRTPKNTLGFPRKTTTLPSPKLPKPFLSLSLSLGTVPLLFAKPAWLLFFFFLLITQSLTHYLRFIDPTVQVSPPMTMMTPPPLDVHTNSLSLSLYLFPLYIFSIYRRHWFLAQFWYPRVSGSIQRHRNGFDF